MGSGAHKRFLLVGLLLVFLIGSLGKFALPAQAATPTPVPSTSTSTDPKRTIKIKVEYTRYWWWLARWADSWITCTFYVEHTGTPTSDDVKSFCGPINYNLWKNTEPCDTGKVNNLNECPGLYLHPHPKGTTTGEREIEVELPTPKVWVTLEGCENEQQPGNRCSTIPSLVFTGEEPLPNEVIISIQGVINGEPFNCQGERCSLPLSPTGADGQTIEFWADSSFGDSSKHYTATVRLVPWGDFMNPEQKSADMTLYYVDVLSSQWKGGRLASCVETWQVFPDVGGPPAWLTSPDTPEELHSSFPYYLLASMLIQNGEVDASSCPNGGIQSPRVANTCGIEAAMSRLEEWQNRFDLEILQVSKDTGVPAQVMKNIFSRESQFWPGIYLSLNEAGLGQLTTNGADTTLLWNPNFYQQFCPLILNNEACATGFDKLESAEQEMLRGALVRQVNAACKDCPSGINLSAANFSVKIFAEGLLANCEQVGQVVYNYTRKSPGAASSYEDLWKFTLSNYNAGPGCLGTAIQATTKKGDPVDWEHVSKNFDLACQKAIDYVNDVSQTNRATPTPTPWLEIGTPLPTLTLRKVTGTVSAPTSTPVRATTATRTPTPSPTGPTATASPTITPGGPTSTPAPTSGYPASGSTATPAPTGQATAYP